MAAFAMLAAALATVSGGTPAAGVAGFGDVADGAFYAEAVQWMVDNNITNGTNKTCFSPGDPVTRGQAAAFMWRMEGSPAAPAHSFVDVTETWQQGPVSWMASEGITTGTSDTTYSPDDVLTRGQLAALLHRLAENPAAAGHPFADVVASWQQEPVAWMVAEKITTGTSSTTFSPAETVTRGQLATFFYRYKGEPAVQLNPSTPGCPWDGSKYHLEFVGEVDSVGVHVDVNTNGRFLAYPQGDVILSVDTLGDTISVASTASYQIVKVLNDGDVALRSTPDGKSYRWDRTTGLIEPLAGAPDTLYFIDLSADGTVVLFGWRGGSRLLQIVDLEAGTSREINPPANAAWDQISLSESGETIVLVDSFNDIRRIPGGEAGTKLGEYVPKYPWLRLFPETYGEELVALLDLSELLVSDGGVLAVRDLPPGVSVLTFASISFAGGAPVVAATGASGESFIGAASVWNYETGEVLFDLPRDTEESRTAGIAADGRTVAFVSTVSRDVRHVEGAALYMMRIID